jgi:4-amino-4-deoxy-L-arabinose transferase-like glycosyltransferase
MVWRRLSTALFVVLWWALNLRWISQDSLLRDGDEESHVGAMELFRDYWLEDGLYTWFVETWFGNYGEYPPLFAGVMGAWWGIVTQIFGTTPPSSMLIRGALLICPMLTAIAVARMAHLYKWNWRVAGMCTLSIPLLLGVSRHFMIEGMVTALSTLSICLALEWKHRPSILLILLTGLTLGLGLLTKQTIVVGAPLVIAGIVLSSKHRLQGMWIFILAACVFSPWFIAHIPLQEQYLRRSAQSKFTVSIWNQITFYPLSIPYALGILTPLLILLKPNHLRTAPKMLWLWTATLILLMGIPKQYPRLLLMWLPVLPLWMAYAWTKRQLSIKWEPVLVTYCICAIGIHGFSTLQQKIQPLYATKVLSRMDDGCPQVWIRLASAEDGGLSSLYDHFLTHPVNHTIAISGHPQVPCSVQSTYGWNGHIDPFLRRRGFDSDIIEVSDFTDPMWQDADIQIEWKGDTIETPMQLRIVE